MPEGAIFDIELQSPTLTATEGVSTSGDQKQDGIMTDEKDLVQESTSDGSTVIAGDVEIMEFEDEEYNQFLQDLQQYPNYFQMETQNCSSTVWRKIAKRIEEEKEEELEFSDLVRIKNQNLEACASYNLGNVDKAEQIIAKVLEESNSSSINACAMMAILKYRKGEITKSKRYLSRIKELAANPYHIDVAKSELAYAYTRLKPKFYKKAIALYTEAVERNPNNIPWKFGLAVIYRRCMSTPIQKMFPDLQLEACFYEAKKHLTYVIENCTDEKDHFFKARSYIELADLYSTTHIMNTNSNDIIDLVKQGVECLPTNTTILKQSERILKHWLKFAEAEELLQKAYSIRPNSYICHQLGLIKKNKIIYQHRHSKQYSKRDQRYDPRQRKQASGSSREHTYLSTSVPRTSTKEKSDIQQKLVVKMTRLINSPKIEPYDLELSRKLNTSLDLFRQSAELGQEQNLLVYYDWGITQLQMIPTKFDEVMGKFNHILEKDRSQFLLYRCYEQYGICYIRMSELQDIDEKSREDYQENAMEMFRRAIRCCAYCQKINLSKHVDSLRSIREIIFGEDSRHGTNPENDMESLYNLVKQYGSSLSLYQEVYDELQHTSDITMDSDVIKGIIRNHLQLQQYTGVLDLLALLLCSKEGLQCLEFKTEILTQMMHYSIQTNDYHLSESVFNFEKDPNEEVDNDVAIIFNEEDQVCKKIGASLQKWLCAFSNSGLKVILSTETMAHLPRLQEQIKLVCNSKMAIFILGNDTPSTLTYLMNTALEARLDNNYVLKKIFPIVINNGMVPDIFKIFRSMKITQQSNILVEQDKSDFLKSFSEIFLS